MEELYIVQNNRSLQRVKNKCGLEYVHIHVDTPYDVHTPQVGTVSDARGGGVNAPIGGTLLNKSWDFVRGS